MACLAPVPVWASASGGAGLGSVMTDRPVSGKWFEEVEGLVIQHVIRRTITEADNVASPR